MEIPKSCLQASIQSAKILSYASGKPIAGTEARKVIDQCGFCMMELTGVAGWSAFGGL